MISDSGVRTLKKPSDFSLRSFRIDLSSQAVTREVVRCEDLEDVFGGIARGFKLLEQCPVDDPYSPSATLVLNLGILSGSDFMTGLRTFFHGYSPLKTSLSGKPSAMWSAGSDKFGTKLRWLDIDEVLFTGRCEKPTLLHIHRETPDGPPVFSFLDAADLVGLQANDKIQKLHQRFPNAHFAVIGPSGEHFQSVRYAAIALSTENQFKSGDNKPRFCGRGGMGGIMGSKNLQAIVTDVEDRVSNEKAPPELKDLNVEAARGKGSAKFRDKHKHNGGGGTWANYDSLNPVHAMPEMNFVPTGTRVSQPLFRDNFTQDTYLVKDESCFRCGISCHKNVYNDEAGKAGKFRAKLDFEPLNLLSSNIGIFHREHVLELCELVDQYCLDSISCGTTISYVMEFNRRNPDKQIAGGLRYGDYHGTAKAIVDIATGKLPELGQGVLRLSQQLGAPEYAMHSKGMEYAAYLPQTNPGYPWALAGGHMSMKTYLLLLIEKDTGMDYWVDAVTNRGLSIIRDDFLGVCKFSGMSDDNMAIAVRSLVGLDIDAAAIKNTIRRTYLRGYRLELRQGFVDADYTMPREVHNHYPQIELPHFNTPEFFSELQGRVQKRFGELLVAEGF